MKLTTPKPLHVSFVIPTYNYGMYLPYCIESILKQSYPHFNIWIVDDGSSDNTDTVANNLCQHDERIQYFKHSQNVGPVANWNTCLEKAEGDLVWLISADDALFSDTILEALVHPFVQNPQLGLAFCRAQIMDEHHTPVEKFIPKKDTRFPAEIDATYTPSQFFPWIAQANFIPVLGTLARKAAYDKISGFDPELIHTGDWYNWLRISSRWDTFYTPKAGVLYRQHQSNLSTNYQNKAYPTENTLLCYDKLSQFLKQENLTNHLSSVALAQSRFKKKHDLPISLSQKVTLKLAHWQKKLL